MSRSVVIRFLQLALVALSPLVAQQETGSILGTVTDPSGSAVPGAVVTFKNPATGATFTAVTDASGLYRAPQLQPGIYNISASAKGFSTLVREGVEVRVADRLRLDFALQVGAVSETIAVSGSAPLLQVEDASIGQVVDNQKITELPLNGRNWLQLATLAPGTVVGSNTVNAGNQSPNMNIGGLRWNQTQFILDGADDTQLVSSGAAVGPPIDALQEFKVQTNNFTADTAGFSGAVLNATVRAGSNAFHGTAYEFLRNRELNAYNFFAPSNQPKPEFTRNQYGASIGGPFRKDKLFFFLNYDGTRQRQANTTSTTVFTNAQKAGNFASALGGVVGTDAAGRPVASGQIFDPFSLRTLADGTAIRDAFPGNIIPASRINPLSKKLIDLVPGPLLSGVPNYVRNISAPLDIDTFVGRVDWTPSSKNTIFGHVGYNDQWSVTDCLLTLPICGGNGGSSTIKTRQLTLGWTRVFSPTMLNEVRIGYTRSASLNEGPESNLNLNSQFGIPMPFQGPHVGGMTNLVVSGYTQLGTPQHDPFFQFVNKYEVADSFTYIHGRHNFKIGFDGRLKLFHNQLNSNWGRGELDFTGVFTRQPGFGSTGNGVADLLTGVVNFARLGSVTSEKDILHDVEWYVQDKWQVNKKLTLSLGVRYFYNPPSWEARDLISSVLYGPGYHGATIVVPNGMDTSTFNFMHDTVFPFINVRRAPELTRGLVYGNHGFFAPRVGIAYQIGPKTVLRSGYGIFYGFPEQVSGNILTVNPPSKLIISNTSNGIDPTIFIDQSVFGPNPFSRALTNPDFFSTRDPYMPPELTHMYNLSVQHEFLPNWLLEVGYVGNHGNHILINTSANDAIPALPSDNSSVQSRRRASPLLGNLPYFAPQGISNYNALTVNVEKRFSAGLSVLANYTWSRLLGNTDIAAQSPIDLKNDYGPLNYDVKGHVSMAVVYELPFGRGKRFLSGVSKAANEAIGGWQIDNITTFQGGFRTTPALTFSLGKTATNSRPDVIGDPTQGAARQPYNWINAGAFAVPTNAQIAAGDFFGNSGTNVLQLPGMVNFDISILKNFTLTERMRLQFRAEFFNFTNTPFLGLCSSPSSCALGTTVGTPTFGKITQAGDPRIVQLGLKLVF